MGKQGRVCRVDETEGSKQSEFSEDWETLTALMGGLGSIGTAATGQIRTTHHGASVMFEEVSRHPVRDFHPMLGTLLRESGFQSLFAASLQAKTY